MDHDDDEPAVEIESLTHRGPIERFGKYRSLGRIGQGGMADVFLALGRGPAGFNKLVVIKRLRETVASDDAFRHMFLDEARLAARLNHPNVVQTYEVFEDAGAFFITMEYLEGQPLGRLTRACAHVGIKLEAPICARIVSDALCGLHYAHEALDFDGVPLQIVHRDVSPQNIFVTYDGQVKVVDFGIAKAERSNTKTQAGFFKGKAAYMAPEQLEGGAIDRRVDVFTTGIVLWELLVGKKLMAAESTAKTLVRLLREPIPRVADLVSGCDPALDQIVARALERDPAARFQTAGQMRDALERYLVQCRHFVRHEDIGNIVGDVFAEVRAERQRQVGEQMAVSSVFPSSGAMPASGQGAVAHPPLDAPQVASMSGISVSRTVSSVYAAPPAIPGVISAAPSPRALWIPTAAIAGIAAVSVAVVFALVDRSRGVQPNAPPPAAAATGLSPATQPVVTQVDPLRATAPAEAGADPPRVDPAPQQPAPRAIQAAPAWRPVRPDGRTAPAAKSPANASPESNSLAAPQLAEPPATRAVAPATPPATATPAATQEGRKFRTSL
jgi:serine/threonine protein kinase